MRSFTKPKHPDARLPYAVRWAEPLAGTPTAVCETVTVPPLQISDVQLSTDGYAVEMRIGGGLNGAVYEIEVRVQGGASGTQFAEDVRLQVRE